MDEHTPGTSFIGSFQGFLKHFRKHGLALGFLLLIALTGYYAYDLPRQDWKGLGDAIAANWHLAIAALATNVFGVFFDFLSWRCAWRAQDVRFPKGQNVPFFLSVFALQLTPMQLGRFVRVAFAFQSGIASLRAGATSELMLILLDVCSLGAVFAAFLVPPGALPVSIAIVFLAGPLSLWIADRLRWLIEARVKRFTNVPFLSWWNVGVYYFRSVDWICVGTVLYIIGHLTGADVTWHAAGASALGASFIASASALPGGLGVSEAALTMGLHVSNETAMKLSTGATILGFRLLTFWFWLPFGWWGLVRVKQLAAAANAARLTKEDGNGE